MARIWKKPYHQCTRDEVKHLWVESGQHSFRLGLQRYAWVYFVQCCSFTFVFSSRMHIQKYLNYYSRKIQPSSRGPERSGWPLDLWAGDHWERQSLFDRLPLYLRQETKRLKVVKALKQAIEQFAKDEGVKA